MDYSTPADTARHAEPPPTQVEVPAGEHPALIRIQEIDRLLETLVASWNNSPIVQNRRWHRAGYDKPIAVTPLDDRIDVAVGETLLAQGHDLSREGISFTHNSPLPYQKIAATFPVQEDVYESVIVRLTWCRFTSRGKYKSGGRFLRTIQLTLDPHVDWADLPRA